MMACTLQVTRLLFKIPYEMQHNIQARCAQLTLIERQPTMKWKMPKDKRGMKVSAS